MKEVDSSEDLCTSVGECTKVVIRNVEYLVVSNFNCLSKHSPPDAN